MAQNVLFPDAGSAINSGNRNALSIIQAKQIKQESDRQNTFDTTGKLAAKSGKYDPEAHANILEQHGLFREAMELREISSNTATRKSENTAKQLANMEKALDIVVKTIPILTPENYPNIKAGLEESKLIPVGLLPEVFNEEAATKLSAIGKNASEKLKTLTGQESKALGFREGAVVQENETTGKLNVLQSGLTPSDKTTSNTLSPADVKAAGFPEGSVVQRDSTGKLNVVHKPEKQDEGNDFIDMTPQQIESAGLPKGTVAQRDSNNKIVITSIGKENEPFEIQSSDANAIRSAADDLFPGELDAFGRKVFNPEDAKKVAAITARAQRLFVDGRKQNRSITHSEAVNQAAREVGVDLPGTSDPFGIR